MLHELVVGGEILELFEHDEMELIRGQLMENLTLKGGDTHCSPEELKQIFIKVSSL